MPNVIQTPGVNAPPQAEIDRLTAALDAARTRRDQLDHGLRYLLGQATAGRERGLGLPADNGAVIHCRRLLGLPV